MKPIEAMQGTWTVAAEVLTGVLASYSRAYCLAGNEEEDDYIVEAAVKLGAGNKASVLAFFTYAEDMTENFIECTLDFANNLLKIDLVIGPDRTPVAQREFTLTAGTEYNVKIHVVKEDDGTGTVVFTVNGVNQLVIEDLGSKFTAGLYGFVVEGSAETDSATFSNIQKYTLADLYSTLDEVKKVLMMTDEADNLSNEEIAQCALQAKALIDGKLTVKSLSADATDQNLKSASSYYAAWLYRKSRDPVGADAFFKEAEQWLTIYIGAAPSTTIPFRSAEADAE